MSIRTSMARTKRSVYKKVLKLIDKLFKSDYYWRFAMQLNGYDISNYTFRKDQIAFVHIPKTGGTSLHEILQSQGTDQFVNLDIHRPISLLCSLDEFNYVTILRNPVDRVWSYYQMVLRNPVGYPYREFAVVGLEYFLKNCWAAKNMSCQYYTAMVYEKVTEKIYTDALENLKKFYAVLSFDHFNEDASRFMEQHNMNAVQQVPHKRKVKYNLPTPFEKELIQRYNQFDIKLYELWLEKNQ